MIIIKKPVVSLLCAGLFLHCVSAYSQGVALVLAAVNNVLTKHNGTEQTLKRGDSLSQGDIIITKAKSGAQIKYNDGTLVSIQENSHFELVSFAPKDNIPIKIQLNSGAMQYESKNKHKAIIETPVVALSILGTKLNVIVEGTACALCQQKFRDNGNNHHPLNFDCKTYVDVQQGLVKGNEQFLGPQNTVQSGVFGSNQAFTPGAIPWEGILFTSPAASNPESFVENTIASSISTTNSTIVNNTITASIINSIAVQTELVPLSISCP